MYLFADHFKALDSHSMILVQHLGRLDIIRSKIQSLHSGRVAFSFPFFLLFVELFPSNVWCDDIVSNDSVSYQPHILTHSPCSRCRWPPGCVLTCPDSHLVFPAAGAAQWSSGEAAGSFERRAHFPHLAHRSSLHTQDRQHQWTVAAHTHTHTHTERERPMWRVTGWPVRSLCAFCVFSGRLGFRRSRLRLKNLLKPKRKKGRRPIKVCLHTRLRSAAPDGNQWDDIRIHPSVCTCVCVCV